MFLVGPRSRRGAAAVCLGWGRKSLMLDARRVAEHVRAQTDVSMGKNFEEKMAIVGAVKERLSSSQLIFSTQANGVR